MKNKRKTDYFKRHYNNLKHKKALNTQMQNTSGITLIALVVTIVVLLILAGITLNYTIGDNGIIKEAQKTKNEVINKTANAEQDSQNLIAEISGEERIDGVTKLIADGSWNVDKQVNTPKLLSGMTGIYWDDEGNEITVTAENYDNWYDYVAQTGTTDGASKWANAKTEDGSYWVWIPRFAYKIESGRYTSTAGKISIKFLQGTSNKDASGNVISTTYPSTTGETMESYVVHPAFRDGSSNNFMNGEWDEELAGFWVAKFEMSMETNGVHTETSSESIGNVLTSTTVKVVSKPGVSSWRYITIGNSYTNAYNYNRTYESHLMKNSEWGAVAYLTQSSYGRNGNEVTMNVKLYTGGGSGATATTNVAQSTTGNAYGIFDLLGGAYERVAAYILNANDALTPGSLMIYSTSSAYPDGYKDGSNQYVTVYPYNSSSQSTANNWKRYSDLKSSTYGYGDAILETSAIGGGYVEGNEKTSWHNGYSLFLSDVCPFMMRGFRANSSEDKISIFSYCYCGGNTGLSGFRVIMAD